MERKCRTLRSHPLAASSALVALAVLMLIAMTTAAFATVATVETFDHNPVLSASETPGTWYVDRYAPAGFTNAFFDGDNRLKLSISSADSAASRQSAYSSTFYNTQGRDYDVSTATVAAADLYVGSDWVTGAALPSGEGDNSSNGVGASRRSDLWVNACDSAGKNTGYPIIGFINGTGFRVWDNLGWHNVGYPDGFGYDKWYKLAISINPTSTTYYIDNSLVYTSSYADDTDMAGCVCFSNVMLQAYNFGDSYDVYWDNAVPVPAAAPYTITTSADANGSVSPSNPTVDWGDDATVTVTPNTGYHIVDVLEDGVSVGASSSVTFTDVTADHSLSATFALDTYTIAVAPSTNGTITPAGDQTVGYGSDMTFSITPDVGYYVVNVRKDGVSIGASSSVAFTNITGNHTIKAFFAADAIPPVVFDNHKATYYTSAKVALWGTDIGSGVASVSYMLDGAATQTVTRHGRAVGTSVLGAHTLTYWATDNAGNASAPVTVTFSVLVATNQIVPTAGAHGAISPGTAQMVGTGSNSPVFAIKPAIGYHIVDVKVDGVSQGAIASYQFTDVTTDHTISATFALNVATSLTINGPSRAKHGYAFKLYGKVTPARTYMQITRYWKNKAGRWVNYGRYNIYGRADGTWYANVSTTKKGSWKFTVTSGKLAKTKYVTAY